MKVPVLADIVRSVEQHAIRQTFDSIWIIVFEDWSVLRHFFGQSPAHMNHNICVFEYRTDAEELALEQPIPNGRVMSVMDWVHQCPEPMAWRDDETSEVSVHCSTTKVWWAVATSTHRAQRTIQFSDFTGAEEYYNSLGETPNIRKQLIKLEVAREWDE